MSGWIDWLVMVFMLWNGVVSAWWAVAALRLAAKERVLVWPVPWRWLVAGWMGWKAAFFLTIDVALIASLPEYAIVFIVVGFTQAHTWAWWRWRHLPDRAALVGGGEQLGSR